ncbi:AAA family ATPase [Lysinibacillus capsici]|uniref:AAA family ATPase n=1 Tax=Lysinibacillus capsici TaxID=2115968 RepID=UPI0036B195DF
MSENVSLFDLLDDGQESTNNQEYNELDIIDEFSTTQDDRITPLTIEEISNIPFYSIKTGTPETVENILEFNTPLEILQLNRFVDDIEINNIVFLVLGGDRGRPEVNWETGLIAIAKVFTEPYDIGYDRNNYKLQVSIELLLDDPIKKEDLVPYRSTYNIPGISPMTKGEPNQALNRIPSNQVVGLVRAILDTYPDIEEELTELFGEQFMENVKQPFTYLVEQDLTFDQLQSIRDGNENYSYGSGAETNNDDGELIEEDTNVYVAQYEPDLKSIKGDFEMSVEPLGYLKNYINISKNVILTGPPGTGKTTFAERAAIEGERIRYIDGYILSTATDDWSTFDTIGGYMPDPNEIGKLSFYEGLVLKSIRENKWLIIDEINRADLDKAFGQMFTVLSGKDVDLPFEKNSSSIKIKQSETLYSYFDEQDNTYWIGRNWRILGTMNTFDKNSLFTFSYAFMRRFGFVEIPIPTSDEYQNLINGVTELSNENKHLLSRLIQYTPRALGPAIINEVIEYMVITGNTSRIEAIIGSVIPQFEGLLPEDIKSFYTEIGRDLTPLERRKLCSFLVGFFELPINYFNSTNLVLEIEQEELEAEND